MPAPYRLILFDFDGTLVDTVSDIAFYVNEVLRERGFASVSVESVKGAVGWGVHELLKTLAPGFAEDPEGLDRSVERFKTAYRARPVRVTRPFPYVVDMLKGPLKNTKKAIVTNKPQDITLRVLEELKLGGYFEAVIGTQADFPPKPDPSASLHVMGSMGVPREETIYIGDSRVDAETSVKAGIDFGWVDYGYQGPGDLTPHHTFSSAAQWGRLVS